MFGVLGVTSTVPVIVVFCKYESLPYEIKPPSHAIVPVVRRLPSGVRVIFVVPLFCTKKPLVRLATSMTTAFFELDA